MVKKISPLDSSMNHNSTYKKTPTEYYLDVYQSKLDEDWEYFANVYDVEIEEPYGSQIYTPFRVRISDVAASTFGFEFTDDYKKLSFADTSQRYPLGTMYRFENNYWLTTNPEFIKQTSNSAIVQRCNNVFRWKDKVTGEIFEEPISIYNKMLGNTNSNKMYLTLPEGYERVYVQRNERTMKMKPNQRFMVGNPGFWNVFRISGGGITNFLNQETSDNEGNSVIVFTVLIDYVNYATDDIVNGIADAYQVDESPQTAPEPDLDSTYIQLSPDDNEVKQGNTKVYTAQLYVAGVPTLTSFTFTDVGPLSKYYSFNTIDTVSFSITNNYMNMKEPIKVTCVCAQATETFDIWLGGW